MITIYFMDSQEKRVVVDIEPLEKSGILFNSFYESFVVGVWYIELFSVIFKIQVFSGNLRILGLLFLYLEAFLFEDILFFWERCSPNLRPFQIISKIDGVVSMENIFHYDEVDPLVFQSPFLSQNQFVEPKKSDNLYFYLFKLRVGANWFICIYLIKNVFEYLQRWS